ncbi:winged helix-turn-helix transcriptional regulator [bacterium]|nr:winged helix-turn-helix transcriptional regulator [bacterium]
MARASTTADVFNAIAEPRRRRLVETLMGRELTVNETARLVGWAQPAVSKHLAVLRQVGLVSERRDGRYRHYSVNAAKLKPVRQWVIQFDQYWMNTLDQLDDYLGELQKGQENNEP